MYAESSLSSLCEMVVDCPHSTPVWAERGKLVLRSKNIRNGRLDLSECSYTDDAHFASRIKRATPKAHDIVITREAPMGECAMIPDGLECCLGQRMVLLRPDPQRVDPHYLLYALQSQRVQAQIQSHEGTGSTVSNLRIPALEALKILTPPMDEQRAIARFLRVIDEKIVVTLGARKTLLDIGDSLFRALLDGSRSRGTGRTGRFADLVTASREKVGDAVGAVVLSAVSSSELVPSASHFQKQVHSADISKYLLVRQWDLAYNPSRINIGSIGMLEDAVVGAVSPVYVVARPREHYRWYMWHSLRLHETRSQIAVLSSGSVRQSLSFGDFSSIECWIPDEDEILQFERYAAPQRARIRGLKAEIATLLLLRDSLLSRLMSGDLPIGQFS